MLLLLLLLLVVLLMLLLLLLRLSQHLRLILCLLLLVLLLLLGLLLHLRTILELALGMSCLCLGIGLGVGEALRWSTTGVASKITGSHPLAHGYGVARIGHRIVHDEKWKRTMTGQARNVAHTILDLWWDSNGRRSDCDCEGRFSHQIHPGALLPRHQADTICSSRLFAPPLHVNGDPSSLGFMYRVLRTRSLFRLQFDDQGSERLGNNQDGLNGIAI